MTTPANTSNPAQAGGSRREAVAKRALDIQAQLLRLLSGRQGEVAEQLDWSESKLSRFKSGEANTGLSFDELAKLLAALNVRLVCGPEGALDEAEVRALAVLAERGLRAMRTEIK